MITLTTGKTTTTKSSSLQKSVWVCIAICVLMNLFAVSRPSLSSFGTVRAVDDYDQQPTQQQQQEQQQKQPQKLIIDIISVGSHGEREKIAAQTETFGSHASIRNFRIFTESDDHEGNCHTDLDSNTTVYFISQFCRRQKTHHSELFKMRSRFAVDGYLRKKGDAAAGWLCAQKRPAESLYKVMNEYKASSVVVGRSTTNTTTATTTGTTTTPSSSIPIPDYLFLLDADTYLNMNNMLGNNTKDDDDDNYNYEGFVPTNYPPNETTVIAGCRIKERVREHNFTFPWGGFGTIFTKQSIERFVQPIRDCNSNDHHDDDPLLDPETNRSLTTLGHRELTKREFERLVCAKIKQDLIGEAFLFQAGMSVADLMYNYVTHWKYVGAEHNWATTNQINGGFCLHADWVVGYFVNHYYLSNHDSIHPYYKDNPEHRIRGYDGSEHYAGGQNQANLLARKQCDNDLDDNCDPETAHICHHVSAAKMRELTKT